MHSTYLREYFPGVVANYDDRFLNTAKSTLIKNSPTENLGVGLIVREKDIDESYIRTYIKGYNIQITPTLEELIQRAIFSDSSRHSITLGLPSPAGFEERGQKLWIWLSGANENAKEFFNFKANQDDNHKLTDMRIVYDIENDRFESRKEYYILRNAKATYENFTYVLDDNMNSTLVNTQNCMHSYEDYTAANDVTKIVSKLDPEIYKFQSYRRSDSGNTGIYIGLKNRTDEATRGWLG